MNSKHFSDYLNILSDFDHNESLETSKLIAYLNNRTHQLTRLFSDRMQDNAFCFQKPLAAGGSVLAPYGQASVQRCGNIGDSMNDMFVLKPNGQVIFGKILK